MGNALAWAAAARRSHDVVQWAATLWVPPMDRLSEVMAPQVLEPIKEAASIAASALEAERILCPSSWLLHCILATRYNSFGVNFPMTLSRLPVPQMRPPSTLRMDLGCGEIVYNAGQMSIVKEGADPESVKALAWDKWNCELQLHCEHSIRSVELDAPSAPELIGVLRAAAVASSGHLRAAGFPSSEVEVPYEIPVHGAPPEKRKHQIISCGAQVFGLPSLFNHS